MRTFVCKYSRDGREFGFLIIAASLEDAEANLQAMRATGELQGERVMSLRERSVFPPTSNAIN